MKFDVLASIMLEPFEPDLEQQKFETGCVRVYGIDAYVRCAFGANTEYKVHIMMLREDIIRAQEIYLTTQNAHPLVLKS